MSDLVIPLRGKNEIICPTYLPIGKIVESERGNKEYFNLGLTAYL